MKHYKINQEVEINELDNELIIILPQTDKMYFCNKISKELICGVRDGLSVEQIIGFVLSKYEIDRTTIESDFDDIISQLLHYKILICEE
mgnify:CR=1 FL=1